MANEIQKMFESDCREKSKSRPRQVTSTKRPKKINMPSDRIDRRKHPEYRASAVKTYNIYRGDSMSKKGLSLDDLPEWKDFKNNHDAEQQKEILMAYCREYEDIEISEAMNGPKHGFRNHRSELGILRKQPINPSLYDGKDVVIIETPKHSKSDVQSVSMGQKSHDYKRGQVGPVAKRKDVKKGMHFTMAGDYTPAELQKRLLALAGMFEDGLFDGKEYNIELHVFEALENVKKYNGDAREKENDEHDTAGTGVDNEPGNDTV